MTTTLQQPETHAGKLASTEHADTLIRNYKSSRWLDNSRKLGRSDSMSVWYGMEALQNFLATAQEYKADGVKMYFGVYPEDYAQTPEFAGRQTILLVATRQTKTGNGLVNKNIFIQRDGKSEILAFNFGSMCPPFCQPGVDPSGIDPDGIGISILDTGNGLTIV
jgi:hypothetical protein